MKPSTLAQNRLLALLAIIGSVKSLPLIQETQPENQQQQQPETYPNIESNNEQQYRQFVDSKPYLQVHKLSNNQQVTCNDGSPIGYYKRLNAHSKSWIIYLQGGGYCGSEQSCRRRWQRSPHLMSSNFWPKNKSVDGILSNVAKDNPFLWNANHIYVPYCSSDSWTGNQQRAAQHNETQNQNQKSSSSSSSSFAFMGSKIIEQILGSLYEELPRESSLHEARYILLAGDSAGAIGVILNLDKVNKFIDQKHRSSSTSSSMPTMMMWNSVVNGTVTGSGAQHNQRPVLRGLADSGWFLDNEPYDFGRSEMLGSDLMLDQQIPASLNLMTGEPDCDRQQCNPLQSIRQAMRHWNGQVPQACAARYSSEPWRCYFAYRAYQTLKTPLFVVQWLYDEAQLMFDNIARPDTVSQWNYVHKMVNQMRASLENVTALFAPSCMSHSLVIRPTWNQINVNGLKLPYSLNSWEEQSMLDSTNYAAIGTNEQYPSPTTTTKQTTHTDELSFTLPVIDGHQQIHQQVSNSNSPSIISEPSVVLEPSSDLPIINNRDSDLRATQFLELRHATHKPTISPTNSRPRQRNHNKRKRNNQQQRAKQRAQRNNDLSKESNDLSSAPTNSNPQSNDNNSLKRLTRDQLHATRSGRSTVAIDDTSPMLNNNNVPDDFSSNSYLVQAQQSATTNGQQLAERDLMLSVAQSRADNNRWTDSRLNLHQQFAHVLLTPLAKQQDRDRFRLIDTCGWPQCNRDCPVPDSDSFNLNPYIHF